MEKEYRKLRKSTVRYLIWILLFGGIKILLSFFQIEYRLWLSVLGYIITGVTPFLLFAQRLVIEEEKKKRLGERPSDILLRIYAVFACIILLFAGLYGLFTMNEERITEEGGLEVAYGAFLSESYWYPFQKVSFWGRKPAYGLEEIKMLEEKYGCKFEIDRENLHLDMRWIRYIPQTYPKLSVKAYVTEGLLQDDFSERYIGSIFSRVYKELDMKSERGYQSFTGGVYHTCLESDWSNPSVLAGDASVLILNALEVMDSDINAPCNSGVLYVVVRYQGEVYHIPLLFGDSQVLMEENRARDYYTSPEHVYEELNLWVNGRY